MTPWEIVERLHTNPDILSELGPSDPFWVGASYAIDPFVGMIYRLPISRDPPSYGSGLQTDIFIDVVDAILAGKVTGDNLARAITAISQSCLEEEWLLWYKPILQGHMLIPVDLETFNKYCPEKYSIRPVRLSSPKPISSLSDLPNRFFIQPEYPNERVFWFIDSRHTPIEMRCFDSKIRCINDVEVANLLAEMALKHPLDIVLFGYHTKNGFLVDDVLTREQFAQEGGAQLLHKRLMAAAALGLQPVQMSGLMSPRKLDSFYKELDLIFQQGFAGVVLRDLDGHYPFRVQSDVLIRPTIKATVTCVEVITGVGIRAETVRGKKTITANVRLGLTESVWRDTSESSVGRKLDLLSCGQKGDEFILPVFQQWRD